MQDTSQTKKQQWMSSEQTTELPAAKNRRCSDPPLQEDIGSHNQKGCHPDSPQVNVLGRTPSGGGPSAPTS